MIFAIIFLVSALMYLSYVGGELALHEKQLKEPEEELDEEPYVFVARPDKDGHLVVQMEPKDKKGV